KRVQAFRAARGNGPANGTRLGSPAFVGFDKRNPVPAGLVTELRLELVPAGVGDRLCHPRPHELAGVHIADDDKSVLTHKPGGEFVQEIFAGVCDLGMDRSGAAFVARTLGSAERLLVLPEMPGVLDDLAVACDG